MKSHEADKAQELVLASTGSSFKTEEAAKSTMAKKGLRSSHTVVKVDDGGYALKPKPEKAADTYFQVRFQAKAQPNDTEDVQLMVNGETLIIAREKKVVVPGRFLECADHAVYNHYRSEPGHAHKIVARIKTYPYERIREATEAEYLKAKTEGTRTVKQNIKKHGFDVKPDDVNDVEDY